MVYNETNIYINWYPAHTLAIGVLLVQLAWPVKLQIQMYDSMISRELFFFFW